MSSLFDISGHGMAAGLVGMLAKNIISILKNCERKLFFLKFKKKSVC